MGLKYTAPSYMAVHKRPLTSQLHNMQHDQIRPCKRVSMPDQQLATQIHVVTSQEALRDVSLL